MPDTYAETLRDLLRAKLWRMGKLWKRRSQDRERHERGQAHVGY
jgi:hypothetical protein